MANGKSRAAPGRPAPSLTSAAAKRAEVVSTVAQARDIGCPCGCLTRPGFDDPGCIRHRPRPAPQAWPVYDVRQLGLAPHDRAICARCKAVAS